MTIPKRKRISVECKGKHLEFEFVIYSPQNSDQALLDGLQIDAYQYFCMSEAKKAKGPLEFSFSWPFLCRKDMFCFYMNRQGSQEGRCHCFKEICKKVSSNLFYLNKETYNKKLRSIDNECQVLLAIDLRHRLVYFVPLIRT